MRIVLCSAAMIMMTTTATLAQGVDWTGAYGGISAATQTGTHSYDGGGPGDVYDLEGPAFGAFGGYMWASGNLVYGAEAAVSFGGVYEMTLDGATSYKDEYEYDRFFDLKGRLGYAAGNFLVYGTLGVSRTVFQSDIDGDDPLNINTNGLIYGLGADYKVTERYFVGAEYLRRNYDFFDSGQDVDIGSEINTFTLRVGLKF